MEVTAKSKDGKFEYKTERHYHTQATTCKDEKMAYGAQNKTSYVRDTSLQPYQTKAESFEIALPFETKDGVNTPTVRTVDVTVELTYEIQNPDNKIPIFKMTKEVTLDR
jgi:hypothetical protein